MKNIQYIITIILFGLISSCVDEDYFGSSDAVEILSIEISGQNGNEFIDTENDSIFIEVANGIDISKVVLRKLELSSFAIASLTVGDTLDFSQGSQIINVTAESGLTTKWTMSVFELGSTPQINNSDFNTWHTQGSYLDLGVDDASSSWGTSNPGATFGGMDPNVQQYEISTDNYAVKLTTRFTLIGSWVGKPIAAGSVFTGDFMEGNISFDDPEASIDFGIPFTATPTSFSVDYKYTPGPDNINASQQPLNFPDTGDIYVILERREDDLIKRVATAWYRIEQGNTNLDAINVDFVYGELPSGTPEYMLPDTGETFAENGEPATHIVVVFSSSAYGNDFQGAENSELIVDNLVLNY